LKKGCEPILKSHQVTGVFCGLYTCCVIKSTMSQIVLSH